MDRIRTTLAILLLSAICGLALGGILNPNIKKVIAQPPPPTKSPAPTPTDTGAPPPTDTPEPTDTQPVPTVASSTPPVQRTRTPKPPGPNPACQSSVSGYVLDQAGQKVAGATVSISGEGWANAMLTNDEGRYGFAGLCAGTVTLQARLPDGTLSFQVTADLDGANKVMLDIGLSSLGVVATVNPSVQTPTPTPEPEMPQTGYPGWALAGGAVLGILLLLFAGARRGLKQGS